MDSGLCYNGRRLKEMRSPYEMEKRKSPERQLWGFSIPFWNGGLDHRLVAMFPIAV